MLAKAVGVEMDSQIIGRLAEKKGSDVVLWDSTMRAAKGALGQPDGSRGMIDAIHCAANAARNRSLESARELLRRANVDTDPAFFGAMEAVLEVLPPSKSFTHIEVPEEAQPAANDFEALEKLRRLAFPDKVDEPQQLEWFKEEATDETRSPTIAGSSSTLPTTATWSNSSISLHSNAPPDMTG